MDKIWRDKQKEIRNKNREKISNARNQIENAVYNLDDNRKKTIPINPLWLRTRWCNANQLYNLFWWEIKIQPQFLKEALKQTGNEYTNVLFLPYIITKTEMDLLISDCKNEEYVVRMDNWGIKDRYPHLNYETGNIHKEFNAESWDGKIKQVVLVKKKKNGILGSRYAYMKRKWEPLDVNKKDFFIFKKEGKEKANCINKIAIPKICHYPQLMSLECCEDTEVKELLDGLLENILDKNTLK